MLDVKRTPEFLVLTFRRGLTSERFQSILKDLKTVRGARFNPDTKQWTVPLENETGLRRLLGPVLAFEDERPALSQPVSATTSQIVLDELSHSSEFPVDLSLAEGMLLPPMAFQLVGASFLLSHSMCILADDMGLGKSIQAILPLRKLAEIDPTFRGLVICPASLKYQWGDEIQKFFGDRYPFLVIDGDLRKREKLYRQVREHPIPFVLINYELVRNDLEILQEIRWDAIVADEVHRIKNRTTKTFKALMQLDAPRKWGLTGTPVQNKPDELFTMMRWINPAVLGEWWGFMKRYIILGQKYGQPNMIVGYRNLHVLHAEIAPHMLRRLKKDVAPQLPPLTVTNRYIEMSREQQRIHDDLREEAIELIKMVSEFNQYDANGELVRKHPKTDSANGMFILLQEICDDPRLLKMSDSPHAKHYADRFTSDRSPKLDELHEILEEFSSEDAENKAVIFTRFERMQRLILDSIKDLGVCEHINGKMSNEQKHDALLRFKTDPNIRFLVATDSANYGVNLQEASLLVNFDLPYNPAVFHQRNNRIHRLNSEHERISIINLICLDGLDESILRVLYRKQELSDTIVENTEHEARHLDALHQDTAMALLKSLRR